MKSKALTGLLISVITFAVYIGGCNYHNVTNVKINATNVWQNAGYRVVGYEGYQIGNVIGNPGGKVWYIVTRDNINYEGFLSKWGDEYHIYSLKALDAVRTPSAK